MPSRRRLPLALTALSIAVGGGLIAVALSPADTVPASVSAPAPRISPSPSVTTSLGPAASVTSPAATPAPAPKAKPDNGLHVDCAKGDDGNNGSLAKPLRSIRAATSRASGRGSVIELARGCTWPA